MAFRFSRRIKILPGVTLNLSKSGVSTSVGPRGAKVTLGHGRVRKTVGLPGTGLSYTETTRAQTPPATAPDAETPASAIGNIIGSLLGIIFWIVIAAALLFLYL